MKILDNISLEETKTLLQNIHKYSDMTKKLGLRGRTLFHKSFSGKKNYVIEYFPALGEDGAWKQAQSVFSKSFQLSPEREEITFIPEVKIKGGMKVYVDDDMVDLSYKKVENLLQK